MALRLDIQRFGGLIGKSQAIRQVFDSITKAARIDVPVLIVGETGTGKELVAQEIHTRSPRSGKPFVAVNMGALSTELVTSELFGHEKGAFTGATESKIGRFEEADGGTLFLDEIATMEERTQIALLRLLETGDFRPVGASHDRSADVRILAATNIDLNDAVAQEIFREDLLYRFQVFPIHLPPLRARREDLPMLVEHFIRQVREEFSLEITGITDAAMQLLVNFNWPGNIRELKNLMAQAAVIAESGVIDSEHLPARLHHRQETSAASIIAPAIIPARPAETDTRQAAFPGPPPPASPPATDHSDHILMPVGLPLEEMQKRYILKTLEHFGNNKTRAARTLEVSRKTLYEKLRRWSGTSP